MWCIVLGMLFRSSSISKTFPCRRCRLWGAARPLTPREMATAAERAAQLQCSGKLRLRTPTQWLC